MRTATVLFENNPFLLFATLKTPIILFATTVTTSESVNNLFFTKNSQCTKCCICSQIILKSIGLIFCRFCNSPDFATFFKLRFLSLCQQQCCQRSLINNNNNNTMKYNKNHETILATKLVKSEMKTNNFFQQHLV